MRVCGRGRVPCSIAVIGEGPGWQEDQCGWPFVGKTGDELDRLLDGIGLTRRDVFLTNLYREYYGKDYEYTAEDLAADEPELLAELARVQPALVVTLGRAATRWLLGDVDMGAVWGIPWYATRDGFADLVVLPIHHPAAGMHNPEMSPYVVAGFQALGQFLTGETTPRHLFDDPLAGKEDYAEVTAPQGITIAPDRPIAIDTEGLPGRPWSLQYSQSAGTARIVRPAYRGAFAELRRVLEEARLHRQGRVTYHSALHDLAVLEELGLPTDVAFDDTMVMAYLLQIEDQGLKALCARHCGMRMDSYDDLLGDAGDRLTTEYLTWLWDAEQGDWDEACQQEFVRRKTETWTDVKGKVRVGRRITKIPELPKNALFKAVQRCLSSKHPRSLWLRQVDDIQVAGYRRLGELPAPTLDYVDRAKAVRYGCRDADGTGRLAPLLKRRLHGLGLDRVYDLEIGTYPLIARMAKIGLKPDLPHFAKFSTTLQTEIDRLRTLLVAHTANESFNANSGDQVAAYLFDELGLDGGRRTTSGRFSTNAKILEGLEHEYPDLPVIGDIMAYREVYKLKNTFVDRLPDFVRRYPYDGRIHPTYRTTRVITGRLAASDPNVLAQPEHGDFAREYKRGWVADDGHYICSWDQSQVELRGLAHLSQDPVLLAVYRGERRNADGSLIDLHATLAQRIFGGDVKAYMHKCRERLAAKAINFGIPMGMTCKGLTVELRKNGVMVNEQEAQDWLDETLALYTGVQAYMSARIAEAEQTGMVRCLSGRLRYIGGIRSRDDRVRGEAERFAFSTPVQESAQWIMKQAEAQVWNHIILPWHRRGRWVEPLVQIHDALKMEVTEGLERELHGEMVQAMTQVPDSFSVPLVIEGEYGRNMADMEALT